MSTTIRACDLEFETRYEMVRKMLRYGSDVEPEDILAFLVWPSSDEVQFESDVLTRIDVCFRGHPMTEANTRVRADGSRNCRECQRFSNRFTPSRGNPKRRRAETVPCTYCGELCWPKSGMTPRCRACWRAQVGKVPIIRGKARLT